jgi:preprotein translocase SecE subunit
MAMSVAENAPLTIERSPRSGQQQLAVGSLLGALYALVSLWIVFGGLPLVWGHLIYGADGKPYVNEFLSATLLIMLCGLVAVALGYVGYQLLASQTQRGLRAGIFFAAVMIFVSLWITEAAGNLMHERDVLTGVGGIAATLIVLGVLMGGSVYLFLQPGWGGLLESVEDQGWFHATAFKASQGIRVRRGTVVGVLTLGICGIVTLVWHRSFGFEIQDSSNDWFWYLPFTSERADDREYFIPLMFKVHLLMPVVLGVILLLFAWRLVNVPAFADFLIATEAEINKVSWTTRKRLVQDTIVVLVTVFLLTIFLFLVDVMWIYVLGSPWVGVLQYNPRQQQQQQTEKNQW